ncbi:MAG: acyl-ACP--UDP-N-acetylglucosamine O-acyltransferase [Myxococcota bacterium]
MSIHPTAIVEDGAQLADDVRIGPYAVVGPRVTLGSGVTVGAHAVVSGPSSIGADCTIFPHAVVGGDPQDKKFVGEDAFLVVGQRNVFREFTTVNRGTGGGSTTIGNDNLFMAYSHVAHDATIGNHCVFANAANIAGHVVIEDNAVLGGLVGVHQYCRIGRCAMVGGGGKAAQDVPPFTIAQGDRARLFGLNIVGLRRNGMSLEVVSALKGAYRELFHQGLPLRIALEQVREVYAEIPEVTELLEFIESSTRGICRSAGTGTSQGT